MKIQEKFWHGQEGNSTERNGKKQLTTSRYDSGYSRYDSRYLGRIPRNFDFLAYFWKKITKMIDSLNSSETTQNSSYL